MAWLRRVLAAVSMAPGNTAVIDYAAFLADFYGAKLDVLHVVEQGGQVSGLSRATSVDARTIFFRLIYRSSELRRALDAHAVTAARDARLILKVGHSPQILRELASTQRYQILVVGRRSSVTTSLADLTGCSVIPVDQEVRIPSGTGHDQWHAPC